MTLTAVSLFSGVGGLDLGLSRAGIEPVLLCEFDAWKRTVLAYHYPEVPIHDDVRTLCDGDSPLARAAGIEQPERDRAGRQAGRVDLVHGGFPCQDVSVAGKRAGLAGNRTGLFWDAIRVVDAVQPRAVLLENVPGLLSSNGGRDFGVVLGELADRGYGVAYRVLDAQHFGVPQRRRRVFVLALAGDDPRAAAERAAAVLALSESGSGDSAPSDEAWADAPARADGGAREHRVVGALAGISPNGGWRIGADEAAASEGCATIGVLAYRKSARVNADPDSAETWVDDGLANTLNAFDVGDVRTTHAIVEPAASGVRRLTPRECERLMGWPDNWTAPPGVHAPDSRRYAACGDGVASPVAEWIGRRLAAELAS